MENDYPRPVRSKTDEQIVKLVTDALKVDLRATYEELCDKWFKQEKNCVGVGFSLFDS